MNIIQPCNGIKRSIAFFVSISIALQGVAQDNPSPASKSVMKTTFFLGETIRFAPGVETFDDLHSAKVKIFPDDLPKVQRLVEGAVVPTEFEDMRACVTYIGKLVFPGYGTSKCNLSHENGVLVFAEKISIPESGNYRVLVFELASKCRLVDDFVTDTKTSALIRKGKVENGKWSYSDVNGNLLLISRARGAR